MTGKDYNNCVDMYADRLFRFVIKSIRQRDEAQDIVQNSFEALWQHYQELPVEKVKAWLFTTAYRKMVDQLRKTKKITYMDQLPENEVEDGPGQTDLKAVLDKGLQRLSETQRTLLLLKDYEGYNYDEIGKITGLNKSQVKVYLHRARLKMKDYLVKIENVI